MNRRAFLRTGAATSAVLLTAPAWCAEDKPAPPSDSELLAETRGSIERHRKSDGTLRVLNAGGKPAAGVKVIIEQLSHDFLFGCNFFLFDKCAQADQEQEYRRRFAALFNYCTLAFYWAGYEPQRGKPNYDYTDRVVEWTRSQAITCKGHPLVWDHPAGCPHWLPDEPGEIARLVTGRVKEIVSRFRGRINIWDVVNEATHLPDRVNKTKMADWGSELGPVPYTAEPLRIARRANAEATLLVNDYRTDPPYYQILTRLRDEGRLLPDAVGIQSHMHQGLWPLHKVSSICQTYAKLGLPLHFTETTILSGARDKDAWAPTDAEGESNQAEAAAKFYTMLFAHPSVRALTWWDLSDYHAWQHAPAGLLREDMSPKPVYEQLAKLIKVEWWTKTTGITDGQGLLSWRGFNGRYRLTAEAPQNVVSEVPLQRASPNQFEIRIPS